MNKKKRFRASILAITMIILGLVLMSALTVSLVVIKQKKASLGAGNSNTAFQTADTGVEKVMQDILSKASGKVNTLSNCVSGIITGPSYTVQLKKADGTVVPCTDTATNVSDIASIKSVGTGKGEQRAIEAAVAAANGCNIGHGFGLYIGKAASSDGDMGGYSGANKKCQDDSTVKAVTGAVNIHMCAADEIIRSVNCNISGLSSGSGWYSSGIRVNFDTGQLLDDCAGWTVGNSSTDYAVIWDGSMGKRSGCNTTDSNKIMCCSY